MPQEATQIDVPNFGTTTDGKKIFAPKQGLERFRQAIHKRKAQNRHSRIKPGS